MKKSNRPRTVAGLGALVCLAASLAGCASNEPRDRMVAVHGLATEVTAIVELGKAPADGPATLASANEAATTLLSSHLDAIAARAIARFEAERDPEGTKISAGNVESALETPRVRAEETSATRKELTGKIVHFRFTVRRLDARLADDPLRIEVPLTVLEDSRAPSDTITFPQDFRAELIDSLVAAVAASARAQGCSPVESRPVPTR